MPFDSGDTDDEPPKALYTPNRRNMLTWLGVAGAGALAGCEGGGDTTTTTTDTTQTTETTTTTTTEPEPQITEQFTEAYSSAAATLNWVYNVEAGTSARIGLTLDGAWAVDTENNVFPLWCDYDTDDGKTYTITVRDGLTWGSGYGDMTAEDWVYQINQVFKSDWAAYPNSSDWVGTTVEQTGDMTFDITLSSVDPAWPLRPIMWGQLCAPRQIFKKYVEMAADGSPDQAQQGLEQDAELNNLTYTGNLGPYKMAVWETEAKFEATRNASYYMQDRDDVPEIWQGAPYYRTFTQRVIPEQSSRLQALKNNEVDTAGIPPRRAQEFIDLEDVEVYVQPQPYVRPVVFNMRANGWKPFRDRRVRQAFVMTVNKQSFSDNIFRGFAKPAFTMQPTWSQWYDGSQVPTYGSGDLLDPAAAREKVQAALNSSPWDLGDFTYDGDTMVNANGNQVQLSLIAQAGQPTEQTMGQVLKQSFEQLGIKVNVETVQGRTFVQNYATQSVPDDKKDEVPDDWPGSPFNAGPRDVATSNEAWDISLIYEFNTYPRTPAASKVFFTKTGSVNYYGYYPSDEGTEIGPLYDEASQTVDEQQRQELFAEVFGLIGTEQPFGFLVMQDDIVGYDDQIVGPVEKFGSGWNGQTYFRTG